MNKNIIYQSKEILDFYSSHRQSWDKFYPSEQWVLNHLAGKEKKFGRILDVGCAGGGLGRALCENFNIESYTGNDIHTEIIDWAKKNQRLPVPAAFISGDIADLSFDENFDLVVSLGCADWNIETDKIIQKCWDRVKPNGYFLVSLRLTTEKGMNDIAESYQDINFSGDDKNPERANYVVLNHKETLKMFKDLTPHPKKIGVYGYWGKPSETARTSFEQILFSVFYIQKAEADEPLKLELNWPDDHNSENLL